MIILVTLPEVMMFWLLQDHQKPAVSEMSMILGYYPARRCKALIQITRSGSLKTYKASLELGTTRLVLIIKKDTVSW